MQIILSVEGMSCGHCVKSVSSTLNEVNGVKSADVNLEKGQATIVFDENSTNISSILNELNKTHYNASLL